MKFEETFHIYNRYLKLSSFTNDNRMDIKILIMIRNVKSNARLNYLSCWLQDGTLTDFNALNSLKCVKDKPCV